MPLAFHAAPPPGHWINDPNGLVFAAGAYCLFVQHRADTPDFRATGWARFSSPDLLNWRFDGGVMPPAGPDWMYSGSVIQSKDGLEAVHTLHTGRLEQQVLRTSTDAGASWSAPEALPTLGTAAANRRDPFVFATPQGWALLLAEPCDWTDWSGEPASRLKLYRSADRRTWREAGTIGPWSPPGVMWEVPVLAEIDGHAVLFISTVDRRDDGAACAVRAWIGAFDAAGFHPHPATPPAGRPVDLGPDFYALMTSTSGGWPRADPVFVGWASSWATARSMPWPGFHGGPISLPRHLRVEETAFGPRLMSAPSPFLMGRFTEASSAVPRAGLGTIQGAAAVPLRLSIASSRSSLTIDIAAPRSEAPGSFTARRLGPPALDWFCAHAMPATVPHRRTLRLFVDGPLIELFLIEDGVSFTAALDHDDAPLAIAATADQAALQIRWTTIAP